MYFDDRYTFRYIVSAVIGLAATVIVVLSISSNFFRKDAIERESPQIITLPVKTEILDGENGKPIYKVVKPMKAKILACSGYNSPKYVKFLVDADNGYRGWVKAENLKYPVDSVIYKHFDKSFTYRYSFSVGDIEGETYDKLERFFGTPSVIIPEKGGFKAEFPTAIFETRDKKIYQEPFIHFRDSIATQVDWDEKNIRKWTFNLYNPMVFVPIALGYKAKSTQLKGKVDLSKERNTDLTDIIAHHKFKPRWLSGLLNFIEGFLVMMFFLLVFMYSPWICLMPVCEYIKYSTDYNTHRSKVLLHLILLPAYLVLGSFYMADVGAGVEGVVILVMLVLGYILCFSGSLFGLIPAPRLNAKCDKKCSTCNHYDSYEMDKHELINSEYYDTTESESVYSHKTSSYNASTNTETITTHYKTIYYRVHWRKDYYDDHYTCRFCKDGYSERTFEQIELSRERLN